MPLFTKAQPTASCSFCGKSHAEVRKLIAGPGVYICDSCITVCGGILRRELAADEARTRLVSIGGGVYNLEHFVALREETRQQTSAEQWDGTAAAKQFVLHLTGGITVPVPASERIA
jgi:hypothetical protein